MAAVEKLAGTNLAGTQTHLSQFTSTAKLNVPPQYQKSYHRTGLVVEAPTLAQDLPENVEILTAMKQDLSRKVHHLVSEAKPSFSERETPQKHSQVRSNDELQAELVKEPEDQDFMDAVKENSVRLAALISNARLRSNPFEMLAENY
jgi:hypothetical protein